LLSEIIVSTFTVGLSEAMSTLASTSEAFSFFFMVALSSRMVIKSRKRTKATLLQCSAGSSERCSDQGPNILEVEDRKVIVV